MDVATLGYSEIELVARAFSAFEKNLSIMSSAEQKQSLAEDCNKQLQQYGLTNALKEPITERTKNIYGWPQINLGHVFDYILKTRDFQRDHIGRYKDEKAYYYIDSGFLNEILMHILHVSTKKLELP